MNTQPLTRSPIEIQRQGNLSVVIKWSDNTESTLSTKILRENCPCAFCKAKRGDDSHDRPLIPEQGMKRSLKVIDHSLEEEITLQEIWLIGSYAIGMKWADGHATGIYTFELLNRLSV